MTSDLNEKQTWEENAKKWINLFKNYADPKELTAELLNTLIEKHHEERYRALLKNVEMQQVFAKSEVKIWECRNCGHIVVGEKAPEICPVCAHPQAYFEVNAENY